MNKCRLRNLKSPLYTFLIKDDIIAHDEPCATR